MSSSLLDRLCDPLEWESFLRYKESLSVPKAFTKELRSFIEEKRYLPVCDLISEGGPFPLPRKAVISKMGTKKKRTVYIYPDDFNVVLKLLTHLLLRTYDGIFDDGLYSFRPGRSAKEAIYRFRRTKGLSGMYAYKVDIHDYFNSVPVERFLPVLEETLSGDRRLYAFLSSLLTEERVIEKGRVVSERKGIMAGTPLASFYANLFLSDLDVLFANKSRLYARYSDDVILFSETERECIENADCLRKALEERSLTVNPDKESFFRPGDPLVFLGFVIQGQTVDIAPATVVKIKQKMRRKRDALERWKKRGNEDGIKAAKAFLRIFNRKLFGPAVEDGLSSRDDRELTWSEWYFPLITTDRSLHEIDLYAQDCARFLMSGTHTKARYNVRYGDLKAAGYRSLVNAYHKSRES